MFVPNLLDQQHVFLKMFFLQSRPLQQSELFSMTGACFISQKIMLNLWSVSSSVCRPRQKGCHAPAGAGRSGRACLPWRPLTFPLSLLGLGTTRCKSLYHQNNSSYQISILQDRVSPSCTVAALGPKLQNSYTAIKVGRDVPHSAILF